MCDMAAIFIEGIGYIRRGVVALALRTGSPVCREWILKTTEK